MFGFGGNSSADDCGGGTGSALAGMFGGMESSGGNESGNSDPFNFSFGSVNSSIAFKDNNKDNSSGFGFKF